MALSLSSSSSKSTSVVAKQQSLTLRQRFKNNNKSKNKIFSLRVSLVALLIILFAAVVWTQQLFTTTKEYGVGGIFRDADVVPMILIDDLRNKTASSAAANTNSDSKTKVKVKTKSKAKTTKKNNKFKNPVAAEDKENDFEQRQQQLQQQQQQTLQQKERQQQQKEHPKQPNQQLSSTTTTTSTTPAVGERSHPIQHGIFYHIFVPSTTEGQSNAIRIVKEQLAQIKASYALQPQRWEQQQNGTSSSSINHYVALYYVTSGTANVITRNFMHEQQQEESFICGSLVACHHVGHYNVQDDDDDDSKTSEDSQMVVTLPSLHSFCSFSNQRNSVVTFLHNQGSGQYNDLHEQWRPALTAAPLSEPCLHQGLSFQQLQQQQSNSNSSCNVCGLTFFAQWTPFFPGNMFSAKCSYVKQLIHPLEFAGRLKQAARDAMLLRLKGQLRMNLFPDRTDFFGLAQRFSDEHWIGSHPYLMPCDCDATREVQDYAIQQQQSANIRLLQHNFTFGMAPRNTELPSPAYRKLGLPPLVMGNLELRLKEYYYLPGNLVKWFSLYGKAPPPNSWAWTWFPDGPFWQERIASFGDKAVDYTTQSLFPDPVVLGASNPTFSAERLGNLKFLTVTLSSSSKAQETRQGEEKEEDTVVFFDVFFPREKVVENITKEEAENQLNVLRQQIEIVGEQASRSSSSSNSPLLSTIYFTVMGRKKSIQKIIEFCNQQHDLNCILSQHYEWYHYGETFLNIHEFCQQNPSKQVVYLTNNILRTTTITTARAAQAEMDGTAENSTNHWMLRATEAATSDVCLNEALQKKRDQCNVCGLKFHSIPFMHMAGKMWAAPCSYLNQLLPPVEFEKGMNEVVGNALLAKISTRISFGMKGSLRLEHMGVDGYAMEHWVGSHPTLLPCDVSSGRTLNDLIQTKTKDEGESKENTSSKRSYKLHIGANEISPAFGSGIAREEMDRVLVDESLTLREYHFMAGFLMKWYHLYDSVPPEGSWVWKVLPMGYRWQNATQLYAKKAITKLLNPLAMSDFDMAVEWLRLTNNEAEGRLWDP